MLYSGKEICRRPLMKKITLGIFGLNRGSDNYESILSNGAEITAVCDKDERLLNRAKDTLGDVALYTDFDDFINHGFDAVYLANYFPEHAPYAVKALEKNVHVISECTAAGTPAECVALVRAAEKSKAIYMLGENYAYMVFNREMQKVYQGGTLGKVLFAEGEYNHTGDPKDLYGVGRYYDSEKHWRNFLPATYYITHSLGPLMMATHSKPVRVTAMPVYSPRDESSASASYIADNAAIVTVLNDDNSVFRVTGHSRFGYSENSYRLACQNGQIENVRGRKNMIMLNYNEWNLPEGRSTSNYYEAEFPPEYADVAERAGHGGSDFYMFRDFFSCIKEGRKPYLDVYAATAMSAVAILGHRSLLQYGVPYDVPDFHREEDRRKYENDRDTPFFGSDGSLPTIPCSSHPDYKPTEEMVERFRKAMHKEW